MIFIRNLLLTASLLYAFVLKLRFPRGTPISTTLCTRYGRNTLSCYRNIERTSEQLLKSQHHIVFLKTCKDYNLTPKFLHFKLYNFMNIIEYHDMVNCPSNYFISYICFALWSINKLVCANIYNILSKIV